MLIYLLFLLLLGERFYCLNVSYSSYCLSHTVLIKYCYTKCSWVGGCLFVCFCFWVQVFFFFFFLPFFFLLYTSKVASYSSTDLKSSLKFPFPNPPHPAACSIFTSSFLFTSLMQPTRSMISMNSVGRSPTGLVKT